MSDLVGNPKDQFSPVTAHIILSATYSCRLADHIFVKSVKLSQPISVSEFLKPVI